MKPDHPLLRCAGIAMVALFLAAITGRLSVHVVNDTPSYIEYPFDSLAAAMLSIRTPGYPIFLTLVQSTVGLSAVPVIQVLLHAIASWCLCEELMRRKMPIGPALLSAFCVLVGCTAADHLNTISTDAPAASLGVLTAALLMKACRTDRRRDAVFCAVLAVLTLFVRPAYLYLIPWLAVAGWLLGRRRSVVDPADSAARSAGWVGAKVAIAVTLLVLGWMGARKMVVSDFGIVPFGHQNLSAILVQTVPPSQLRTLPGPSGQLGRAIADELQRGEFQLPAEAGGGIPTMTIESQWGQINYEVVWPLAREIESQHQAGGEVPFQVGVHHRIAALNRSIVSVAPQAYARWLLLAMRRSVWGTAANLAMHPLFLLMILIGLVRIVVSAARRASIGPVQVPAAWGDFALVGISYAVFAIAFVSLTSPPIGRFADAGAIFLPALVASLFVPVEQVDRDGSQS